MPHATPIPTLATLAEQPSWHNRAGRVDRSSCFTLTASQLWRHVHDDAWRYTQPPAHSRGHTTPRSPSPPPAHSATKRADRVGSLTLTAEDLWHYHRFEQPAPLRGDFRTTKANAFKPAAEATRWWNEVSTSGRTAAGSLSPSPLDPPAVNPNRGAGFAMHLKMLGLPADWSTALQIERYIQHARLKQHFLVCPVCGLRNDGPLAAGSQPAEAPPTPRSVSPPPRPSAGRGPAAINACKNAASAQKKLPAGRVTKLFLPLCTPREWHDAQLAHLWLQTHTRPNRPHSADAQTLLARYAELFPGRQLRCRQCLGLRYGEVEGMG